MYFLIPIQNLFVERVMKLGNSFLIPTQYFIQYWDNKLLYENNHDATTIHHLMEMCLEVYSDCYRDNSAILMEYNAPAIPQSPDQQMLFLESICNKADRCLDFIRLVECDHFEQETIPGLPGIASGYRNAIAIDTKKDEVSTVLGKVFNHYHLSGLGLYSDIDSPQKEYPNLYRNIFSSRTDEVYLACRAAYTRINESMYFNNINIAFIYLISTIEMLANSSLDEEKHISFKKTKGKILKFLYKNQDYDKMSEFFKFISKDVRTLVVYKGVDIADVYNNDTQLKTDFRKLVSVITDYCDIIIGTGITTFDELDNIK